MISGDFRVLGCRCIAGAGTQLPSESIRFSLLECIRHVRDPLKKVPDDGDEIKAGDKIARICGSARFLLNGERVALNYMQRMSGIATETNKYVKALEGSKAKIVDTRKIQI